MNHPRRWIVASGLLLTGAAIAVQLWPESPKDEQVATAATPAFVQPPASVPQRAFEPDAAKPAQQASSSALPRSGIGASAAMQDYGQIVLAALHGGTPKQAGEAAKLIADCQFAAHGRDFVERLKSRGDVTGETAVSMTARAEQRLRRCQSITPDMTARIAELAQRGILSGMKGLGDIYGRAVDYAPPPAMRRPLINALRADFLDGRSFPAYMLGTHGESFGLSRIEARAYALAARMVEEQWHRSIGVPVPSQWREFDNTLSAEDLQRAEALATEWFKSVKVSPDRVG